MSDTNSDNAALRKELEESGIETNGVVILDLVKRMASQLAAAQNEIAIHALNEQKRIGEFSNLLAELGNEQSRRLIGETSEKQLRAALLEFVHCENKFGHTGQHPEAECVDCKRVNAANDALGHGYLHPAPQEAAA